MTLEVVRRIRGNLHGSIDVTAVEDAVMEHPYFQRLRRIKQLAFLHYVFPGATHTRFEHSLGVMHLAGVAWEKLKANQQRLYHSLSRYPDYAEVERAGAPQHTLVHGLLAPTFDVAQKVFRSDYIFQALRLAGLMHDIGHPPFSHSGERFMPSWRQVIRGNPGAADYIKEYLEGYADLLVSKGQDPDKVSVRHEVYSILMIEKVLNDVYQKYPQLTPRIDPRDVIAIIAPGIQPAPTSPLVETQAYQLCHELISGELDIDRMDYLLRDSRECGVVYGVFDEGRILDSLCLYYDPEDKRTHVAINFSGLAAFEDYLRARHSMYLQLYFHKTSVSCEAMMQHIAGMLNHWHLPESAAAYAACDEYNIGQILMDAAKPILKKDDHKRFAQMVQDLLYHRTLWKRVYETSAGRKEDLTVEGIKKLGDYLTKKGYRFEQVSSATSLTRFRPRQEHERSRNYLRLIKKDEKQFPRVYPIEDYSDVIAANDKVYIQRIYLENSLDPSGKPIAAKVKQELPSILKDLKK